MVWCLIFKSKGMQKNVQDRILAGVSSSVSSVSNSLAADAGAKRVQTSKSKRRRMSSSFCQNIKSIGKVTVCVKKKANKPTTATPLDTLRRMPNTIQNVKKLHQRKATELKQVIEEVLTTLTDQSIPS